MTPFAEARRSDQGLVALAVVAGLLLVWGAFALLPYTDDADLTMFWARLAIGAGTAAATVWATSRQRWLLTTFMGLACCITPVGEGWTWVAILYIVLAMWAFVKFIGGIMTGHVG